MADNLEAKMAEAVNDAVEDGSIGSDSSGGSDVSTDDATTDTATDTATEQTTTPDPTTTAATTELPKSSPVSEEIDELAKELGLKPRADGKENRLPYSRVKSIVANAQKKAAEERDAAVKEHTTKVTAYEQRLQEIAQVEKIMAEDPERFLAMLPSVNPAYANLAAGKAAAVDPNAGMPQPNIRLGDGSVTYDTAGLQKLMAWQAAQVESRIEQKYTQRFGPIEQSFKSQQLYQAALPKVTAQLDAAAKLPLFNENKSEILAVLQANPNVSLEGAYQMVCLPKLQANRDTMRADIIKELQNKPVSTSTSSTAQTSRDGTKSLEEKMLDALKAGGMVK